jgi:hypothetical protein
MRHFLIFSQTWTNNLPWYFSLTPSWPRDLGTPVSSDGELQRETPFSVYTLFLSPDGNETRDASVGIYGLINLPIYFVHYKAYLMAESVRARTDDQVPMFSVEKCMAFPETLHLGPQGLPTSRGEDVEENSERGYCDKTV